MSTIYPTEFSLFFSIIPKHIDAFVQFWLEFKNSVTGEISHLHLQSFMNGHFHFLIIVELVVS